MPAARLRSRPLIGLGAGAALLGAGYLAATWYRYGRAKPRLPTDALLDRFMPAYEVAERHEIVVNAPATVPLKVLPPSFGTMFVRIPLISLSAPNPLVSRLIS